MGNSNAVQAAKLPWRVRLCFGAGSIGKTGINVVMAAFMLFFYVDVMGMDSVVVSAIILIAKIWDIINDPMMGFLVDRTTGKKEGKCRFWLKYFSVPGGVCLALCMFMPELTATGKIIWVVVTYLLQGMVATILLIPMNTMIGRLSNDPAVRATLSQVQGIFGLATSFVVSGYTMSMVAFFGAGDMRVGFYKVGIIYGIGYALSHLIVYFGTKGYDAVAADEIPDTTKANAPEEKLTLRKSLKALLQNKVWVAIVFSALMINLAVGIEQANLPFYFQYSFSNSDVLYSVYSTCSLVGALIPYLLLSFFIKWLGNARTAALGCALTVVGYMFRFAMADANLVIMIIGFLMEAVGQGLTASVLVLSIFDSRVYGLWKTGTDNEAVLMSGFSSSYKIGLALGTPVVGVLLKLVPYVQGAAEQAESVLSLLRFQATALVGFMFIIPFFLYVFVVRKNEKNLPMMRAEIEARKKAVENND